MYGPGNSFKALKHKEVSSVTTKIFSFSLRSLAEVTAATANSHFALAISSRSP